MKAGVAALAVVFLLLAAGAAGALGGAQLKGLSAPASVTAGTTFKVKGAVAKLPRRGRASARLGFTLLTSKTAKRGRSLGAKKVRWKKGGSRRSFALRLAMPAGVTPGRYQLKGCIRRSCRLRAVTVAARGGPPIVTPDPGPRGPDPVTPAPDPPPGTSAQRSLRAPLTGENFYHLMPDRFENGDESNDRGGLSGDRLQHGYDPSAKGFFHGGDLAGLTERLDYIENLGTTAVWLTPPFKNAPVQAADNSAGYHGYWVTDFTQVDPHYGTNAELAQFVDAAHARGIKVFFDAIVNHTADVISHDGQPNGRGSYVPKDETPYRTAAGNPFDDRDFAGTNSFPALAPATSFPYVPENSGGKVPSWLNDPTNYHNRGNTTFAGESALYGDFFGLDDLFTEKPEVVDGMIDIYKQWITDFRIDGFRIDTMKHVNDEFWQRFAPELIQHAHDQGLSEFFMFGEVFDTAKPFTSHFTTHDNVQAVSDFPFQAAAQRFSAASAPTDELRDFFEDDDWYTDADSNAYQLQTFLGNHDMGRIGMFLRSANSGASDVEIFSRDVLAHELMYLSRGNPTVYYGDEQGFVGDGGDQDARQDMFPSQVTTHNDDDLIQTDATTADSNFDQGHPLYEAIAELAQLTREHPALRNGPQQHRYSGSGPGIYAFSRLDRASQHEYVVALNNSEQAEGALVPTSTAGGVTFQKVYGSGPGNLVADGSGGLTVTLPALSAAVYRAAAPIPQSPSAPAITVDPLPGGGEARGRAEVLAEVSGNSFYDVTFHAKVGDEAWQQIGTDDNRRYRVFHDITDVPPGTTIQYRAAVLDNAGHTRASDISSVQVAAPLIAMTAPADGGNVRGEVTLRAEATPDQNHYSVTFERNVDENGWTPVGTDASQGAYSVVDDISDVADQMPISYRAVLTYATGQTVTSAERSVTVKPPVTTAVVHYRRAGASPDYSNWGLHFWGDATADASEPSWDAPRAPDGFDTYGAYFEIPITNDLARLFFVVHKPNGETVPTDREPGGDRSIVPFDNPEIWLKQGDATIYFSEPTP